MLPGSTASPGRWPIHGHAGVSFARWLSPWLPGERLHGFIRRLQAPASMPTQRPLFRLPGGAIRMPIAPPLAATAAPAIPLLICAREPVQPASSVRCRIAADSSISAAITAASARYAIPVRGAANRCRAMLTNAKSANRRMDRLPLVTKAPANPGARRACAAPAGRAAKSPGYAWPDFAAVRMATVVAALPAWRREINAATARRDARRGSNVVVITV